MNVRVGILDEDGEIERAVAAITANNSNAVENNEIISNENISRTDSNQTNPIESEDFDLTLTASHSYLGSNLEELRGRTILDEGIYINLPIIVQRSTILFPGQTLPMAAFGSNVDMLSKCIKKNGTFGVLCFQENERQPIGTTAEIYEFTQGDTHGGFRIKAKGRQRFKTLKMNQGYHELTANVKIIPEILLPHPFHEHRLTTLDAQRARSINKNEQKSQDKIERLDAAITYWPAWVYRQYDPYRLANKIQQQLQFIETKGSTIPTDPTDLSFWVAQNLPLSDDERLKLLKYDNAIPRLQWELKFLTKDRVLVCQSCKSLIGKQSDIFPMSKEGPQSTFCNLGGFLHDTVTLYNAENLKLDTAPPSFEYSWFPGYAWTIATCESCDLHMGWKFTAKKNSTLRPSTFWGLTRKSLKSIMSSNIRSSDESDLERHSVQDHSDTENESDFMFVADFEQE